MLRKFSGAQACGSWLRESFPAVVAFELGSSSAVRKGDRLTTLVVRCERLCVLGCIGCGLELGVSSAVRKGDRLTTLVVQCEGLCVLSCSWCGFELGVSSAVQKGDRLATLVAWCESLWVLSCLWDCEYRSEHPHVLIAG